MSEVDKLASKITEAVQKAGGEAARLWPDMVAASALSSWLSVVMGVLLALGGAFVLRMKLPDEKDCFPEFTTLFRILGVLMVIVGGVIFISNLPAAVYPEQALVRRLIGR